MEHSEEDKSLLNEALCPGTPRQELTPLDREELFEKNKALVIYTVKKLGLYNFEDPHYEDILQQGYLGLWKSCMNFNPELGFQFATYAVSCIRTEIANYNVNLKRTVRLPRRILKLQAKMQKYGLEFPLSEEDIQLLLSEENPGFSRNTIESYVGYSVLSLDYTIDEDESTTLQEVIPDPHNCFEELENLTEEQLDIIIPQILDYCNFQQSYARDMVEEYIYAAMEGVKLSQIELAAKYNVSQPQVARNLRRAHEKCREHRLDILKLF